MQESRTSLSVVCAQVAGLLRRLGQHQRQGVDGAAGAKTRVTRTAVRAAWQSVHTSPVTRAMTLTPSTMRTAPIRSKTTPLRTILVIGTIPEP